MLWPWEPVSAMALPLALPNEAPPVVPLLALSNEALLDVPLLALPNEALLREVPLLGALLREDPPLKALLF